MGDEIEITTRHAQASDGIKFTARLDDERISLEKITCPVGTSIHIKIPERLRAEVGRIFPIGSENPEIYFGSPTGHYFLKKPSLKRVLLPSKKVIETTNWLPQPDDDISEDWRCFKPENFEKIFWSYKAIYPSLSCNGIIISNYDSTGRTLTRQLARPNISAFDKDGYLPVNLQRTGLQSKRLPFHDELIKSITNDLIAYAIAEAPECPEDDWFKGKYPGFAGRADYYNANDWADWALTPNGFVLNNPSLLKAATPEYLVIGIGGMEGYHGWAKAILKASSPKTILTSYLPGSLSDLNNRIKGLLQQALWGTTPFFAGEYERLEIFIPQVTIEKISKKMRPGKEVRMNIEFVEAMEMLKGDWRYGTTDLYEPFSLKKIVSSLTLQNENPAIFVTARIVAWKNEASDKVMANHWLEILKQSEIPFDKRKREILAQNLPEEIKALIQIRKQESKKAKKRD